MSDKQYEIKTRDGEDFTVPVEGSLGLLALGDVGLILWRQKVESVKREMAERSLAAGTRPAAADPPATTDADE